jgi:hypothetical protein
MRQNYRLREKTLLKSGTISLLELCIKNMSRKSLAIFKYHFTCLEFIP